MAVAFKRVPRMFNLNRTPGRPINRKKIHLIFDEDKRKDFITGFRKRKLQRRQKAQQELTEKLKEEKKRIKKEIKNKFKTSLSRREIPELEELLSQKEYEDDGKTVSILELNINNLVQGSNWIGENKPTYEDSASEVDESKNEDDKELVPGMKLNSKKNKKVHEDENDQLLSKKELSRAVQKETMRKTRKSKVFKQKQNLDRHKNKKKSRKTKFLEERTSKKTKKTKTKAK